MADHNKPVLTSTYANFVSELDARFDDLALGLDPAVTSATNLPVNTIRWNSVLAKDQKWNGSTWADKSSFYELGSVRFNNGTVSAPSITFNDDTGTGIFKPTPTSIALTTSGVEALRTINGNVLVGTTATDGARMKINASGVAAGLTVGAVNQTSSEVNIGIGYLTAGRPFVGTNTSSNPIEIGTRADADVIIVSSSTERARITSDGNLLLGTTTNTGHKLKVDGRARITNTLNVDGRIVVAGGYNNDYDGGSLEIRGSGPSALPTIGFNNPGVFAGSLRQNNANSFGFYTLGGWGRANLEVAQVNASDGFLNAACVTNARNPIWRFGNKQTFGISFFQGTAGYDGKDSIGVHFGTLNGGGYTGQDSHVTFNEDGVVAKQFQGLAAQSKVLRVIDAGLDSSPATDRFLTHITPNAVPFELRADFAIATVAGTGGDYAGVMTFVPNAGTTASTGGPGYQLAFGSTENNGGSPQLRIRNGIDSTWNSWVDVMPPAGAVMHFAMSTAPSGYLKANGAAVSRIAYRALFDAIGTTFGAEDGGTTFNLPDLRGNFIRGWGDNGGVDSGRVFGSFQTGSVESHTHAPPVGLSAPWLGNSLGGGDGSIDGSAHVTPADRNPISGNTQAYGGTETRPRNVALLACIKF